MRSEIYWVYYVYTQFFQLLCIGVKLGHSYWGRNTLRVFENWVLKNKSGTRRVMKSRMWWAGHVACMGHRRGTYRLWVGRTDWTRPLGILRNRWKDGIKMDFKKWDRAGIELIWPNGGTGGGLLWKRQWTIAFHKMHGKSWLAENILSSLEGLCSVQFS